MVIEQRQPCPDKNSWKKCNDENIILILRIKVNVTNVCDTSSHGDTFMYQIWYVIAQKNLWPVDFEVKGQHLIMIMNVRDTSSQSYTPMCQKWLANAKANKRPMGHIAHLRFESTNTFEQS